MRSRQQIRNAKEELESEKKEELVCFRVGLLQALFLFIYINMFLFKKKQQNQVKQVAHDKNIKFILAQSKKFAEKSSLQLFYKQLSWNPIKTWPQFGPKYERELFRINKTHLSWNYSDMKVIRNSIRKSMQSQTLSVMAEKWCENLTTFVIEPMCDESNSSKVPKYRVPMQQKQQLLKSQVLLFCQFCFALIFQIYQFFFNKHYTYKSKQTNQDQWSKNRIYEYESIVFEDYIRNTLTGLDCFTKIYPLLIAVLNQQSNHPSLPSENEESIAICINKQLGISGKLYEIYEKANTVIASFQTEPSLEKKLWMITSIMPSIDASNLAYYQKHKIKREKQKETVSTPIIRYLLKYFCPEIISSFRYVKLLICYRNNSRNIQSIKEGQKTEKYEDENNFIELLNLFCILWMEQEVAPLVLVVFDAFKEIN